MHGRLGVLRGGRGVAFTNVFIALARPGAACRRDVLKRSVQSCRSLRHAAENTRTRLERAATAPVPRPESRLSQSVPHPEADASAARGDDRSDGSGRYGNGSAAHRDVCIVRRAVDSDGLARERLTGAGRDAGSGLALIAGQRRRRRQRAAAAMEISTGDVGSGTSDCASAQSAASEAAWL